MSSTASNIAKGIVMRLLGRKKRGNDHQISWFTTKILKHQTSERVKNISLDNNAISYKNPHELLHTYPEIFGKGIYHFTANNASPLIIDCGSNIGLSVLYFKRIYPQSTVIAFEPDDTNCSLLKQNIAQNNLQNVEVHRSAVWTQNGSVFFDAAAREASRIQDKGNNTREVKSERLADLLAKHNHIDFLKIDIEGAEYEVIKDCAPYLRHVQHLFLEYHGKANETAKLTEILGIVRDNGFSVYVQHAADTLEQPFVNKTTPTQFDVQLNLYCYKNN